MRNSHLFYGICLDIPRPPQACTKKIEPIWNFGIVQVHFHIKFPAGICDRVKTIRIDRMTNELQIKNGQTNETRYDTHRLSSHEPLKTKQ